MREKPVVSVVIGSYNRLPYLKNTIASLRDEIADMSAEIIIIDGGSTDGSLAWLTQQKDIITIIQHNRGEWLGKTIERKSWGYFMNLGFKIAKGTYTCMISDDCLVVPGALKNGIALFDKQLKKGEKVGAMAFYWRNWPEQQDYWVGLTWGEKMFVNHGLYLTEALQKINYIDEDAFTFYHADGDLSLRIWDAGYSIIDSPSSYIEHYSDANTAVRTTNMERQQQDWATYTKRWKKLGTPKKDWIEKPYTDATNTANRYWAKKKSLKERLFS